MDATIYAKQLALKAAGFDPGPLDGIDGPKTRAAWARFTRKFRGKEAAPSDSLPIRVVQAAQKCVGIREEGNNGGEDIRRIQSATWLKPSPWPWCAAFVCHCIREAFGGKDAFAGIKRPRTAGAWDFEAWADGAYGPVPGVRLIKPFNDRTKVEAGDIVIFTFSHIGIAEHNSDPGEPVATIEGNTDGDGGREGDGVYRKTRRRSQIRSIIRLPKCDS